METIPCARVSIGSVAIGSVGAVSGYDTNHNGGYTWNEPGYTRRTHDRFTQRSQWTAQNETRARHDESMVPDRHTTTETPCTANPGKLPDDELPARLGFRERQLLLALIECAGRVVAREELASRAGISDLSERRCDSILVALRRSLPADAIRTVRKRGWILEPGATPAARRLLVEG